jgi:type II secretory pathway pseudopilin PulG
MRLALVIGAIGTGLIVVIVVVVVVVVLLLALLPRLRRARQQKRLESKREQLADRHRSDAEDAASRLISPNEKHSGSARKPASWKSRPNCTTAGSRTTRSAGEAASAKPTSLSETGKAQRRSQPMPRGPPRTPPAKKRTCQT